MKNIELSESGRKITILDQTLLPGEEKYIEITNREEMFDAIATLKVRGAPAIGIFAAYSMAVLAAGLSDPKAIRSCCGASRMSDDVFISMMVDHGEYLKSARPTAVNLAWAIDRVIKAARIQMFKARNETQLLYADAGPRRLAKAIRDEAEKIHEEDKAMCRAIAEYGLEEIKRLQAERRKTDQQGAENDPETAQAEGTAARDEEVFGVLTHCNAGPLATSEYGTALGPLMLAAEQADNASGQGVLVKAEDGSMFKLRAFADETRPLLQGARLTTYELQKAGIDVTLICDTMASMVMKNGWVQACFVGCDRVAANGDTANKIGTSGVAILAAHYGIPFYVLGPTSSIDLNCPSGADIPIEERDPDEIRTKHYAKAMAPEDVKCFNPAFDVTDHELITAIITEKGVCRPPFADSLAELNK